MAKAKKRDVNDHLAIMDAVLDEMEYEDINAPRISLKIKASANATRLANGQIRAQKMAGKAIKSDFFGV
ncbi:MAG: hypothetical protein DRR06_09235 [Gammaproteobacteria bacterium]|nr:MAG: hypothetical protein DRR06_09235 [Gammaproteobacteria bacterium]